jgi:transposase
VTWPAIWERRDYILEQMAAGVTMATIWQRLRDEGGLGASVASLRRYVAANLPEEARRSQVRVLRLDPPEPGAEAQIDYGRLGRWLDAATGRLRTVWAFAMVLCCSRHMFVRPVITMDQHAWTECHVAAFEFFGGVPGRLVPDNLKTGVDGRICMTRRSTGRMPSSLPTMACSSTRQGHGSLVIRRRWSGRCRISGTASGEAGSSPA